MEYFCPSTNFTLDVTTPAKYAATALAHHVGFGHVSPTATQQVTAVDPDRCRVTLPAIRTRKIYGCVFFTVRRRRVEINKITPPGFLVVGINWSKLERFVSFLFSPCIGPIPWKQKIQSVKSNNLTPDNQLHVLFSLGKHLNFFPSFNILYRKTLCVRF